MKSKTVRIINNTYETDCQPLICIDIKNKDQIKMTIHLEPTYLRYIYDGLTKGAIHPDNASALPEGLIGLYEAAFNENTPVTERQKLLDQFTIWALLKKEVSANFVAEVLGEKEEVILNFIATYSKWFNSPESGKYQLYHERLRVFLLQKLSEKEVQTLHEKLIFRLQKANKENKEDEFEYYALQYLSHHLLVEAFANNNGDTLLSFVQNKTIWDRQIEISNGFKWSQEGLRNGINFGIKDQSEEVIDCGLGLVDLYYQEQNDIKSILKMVGDNEMDLALQRIEAIGGPEPQENERQFVVYMLCLMELLLCGAKTQAHKTQSVQKLIKHLEENINWNLFELFREDLFSPYLMFLIAVECKSINADYLTLYKEQNVIEANWIENSELFNETQLEVLFNSQKNIQGSQRSLSFYFAKHGLFDKALQIAENIERPQFKAKALSFIKEMSSKIRGALANPDPTFEINIQNYIMSANEISSKMAKEGVSSSIDQNIRSEYFSNLSATITEIAKFGDFNLIQKLILESLAISNGLGKEKERTNILRILAEEFKEIYLFEKTFANKYELSLALSENSEKLLKQKLNDKAFLFLEESLKFAELLKDNVKRITALLRIYALLNQHGKFGQANLIINRLINGTDLIKKEAVRMGMLIDIAEAIFKTGDKDEAINMLKNLIITTQGILEENARNESLNKVIELISKCGQIDEAITYARAINDEYWRAQTLISIVSVSKKSDLDRKKDFLFEEILQLISAIKDIERKETLLTIIAGELIIYGNKEKADTLIASLSVQNNDIKAKANKLYKIGLFHDAKNCAVSALALTQNTTNEDIPTKMLVLVDICSCLAEQKLFDEAFSVALEIRSGLERTTSIKKISELYYKTKGLKKAIQKLSAMQNNEAAVYWKKGMADALAIKKANKEEIIQLIYLLNEDLIGIDNILLKYAMNCVFFKTPNQEKLEKFNKVLNIQWAIDIKNQLPN